MISISCNIYNLSKFKIKPKYRINQKPLVKVGDVIKGDIIADGPHKTWRTSFRKTAL